jgi:hypothetical protein
MRGESCGCEERVADAMSKCRMHVGTQRTLHALQKRVFEDITLPALVLRVGPFDLLFQCVDAAGISTSSGSPGRGLTLGQVIEILELIASGLAHHLPTGW